MKRKLTQIYNSINSFMANHLPSSVPLLGMIYLSGRFDKCYKFKFALENIPSCVKILSQGQYQRKINLLVLRWGKPGLRRAIIFRKWLPYSSRTTATEIPGPLANLHHPTLRSTSLLLLLHQDPLHRLLCELNHLYNYIHVNSLWTARIRRPYAEVLSPFTMRYWYSLSVGGCGMVNTSM